jgi:hypothetical protein
MMEEEEEVNFIKERQNLRQYYKQLKAGMIDWADIPYDYQILLMKYYGISR